MAIRSSWSEPQSAPGLVLADGYRTSPSLTAKNIISLISVLTIWWWPCVESSLVLLEEGVCYEQCVLLAILCEPLPCFILYSKGKFACYSWYLLTSYFFIPVSYDKKDIWDLGSFPLLSLLWILFWFDWPSSFNLFILLGFYLVPSSGIYSSAVSFCLTCCDWDFSSASCRVGCNSSCFYGLLPGGWNCLRGLYRLPGGR